jgi:hypothetical protein
MKKLIISLICILTFLNFSYTQIPDGIKNGGYLSFKSLINNIPDFNSDFVIKKRTKFDIAMVAGNDYKITSGSTNLNPTIKNDIWFIFSQDSLYINGKFVNGYSPYCKVENNGTYLYFSAGIPKKNLYKKYGFKRSMIETNYVPIGGAIGGAVTGADLALARFYYFLDTKSGEINLLTKESLLLLLSQETELRDEFLNEKLSDYSSVQLKYLDKLSKR